MNIEELPRTQSAPPTLEEHQKIQEEWPNQQEQVRFLSRNKRAYSEASLTVDSVGDAAERNLALFASGSTEHEPRVSIHHDAYMVIRPRIESPTTTLLTGSRTFVHNASLLSAAQKLYLSIDGWAAIHEVETHHDATRNSSTKLLLVGGFCSGRSEQRSSGIVGLTGYRYQVLFFKKGKEKRKGKDNYGREGKVVESTRPSLMVLDAILTSRAFRITIAMP
ncbi:hypothetical protein AB5N19_02952 [Seiridium cardinale]